MCGGPANSQTRTVRADVSQVVGPHTEVPLRVVGAGRASEGLRADWQEQLAILQNEIGFQYIRMHGILHDDMGVYREDAHGNPEYNFQYVDALYDALLKQHIRPFVELTFMPSKLAGGTQTIFWWKGNINPPKDPAKWSALIRAFVAHLQQRYGSNEVKRWYFEVWNEPDLRNLFFTGWLEDYLTLYKNTAESIKAECPACRVGGPANAIARTVVLKLKTSEFNILTRSHTPSLPPDSCETFTAIALSLRKRVHLGASQRFRLVSVGLSNFQDVEAPQSPVFR